MRNWRDIKRAARADIHRTFQVPAVYLSHVAGTPLRCDVRLHSKVAVNQNEFTWPATPGYLEIDPYAIFNANQVAKPLRNAFLIFSPNEMYRLGPSEPDREGYVKVTLTTLDETDRPALIEKLTAEYSSFSDGFDFGFGPESLPPPYDGIISIGGQS